PQRSTTAIAPLSDHRWWWRTITSRVSFVKYVSGRMSAIARRNAGYSFGVKNVPEMIAIGRYTALTTADEPSAVRTRPVSPSPSAANDAAPITSTTSSEFGSAGRCTEKRSRPRTISRIASIRNVTNVDASTAARYVQPGSGVERIRFSTPLSRRITIVIASPANAVDATP